MGVRASDWKMLAAVFGQTATRRAGRWPQPLPRVCNSCGHICTGVRRCALKHLTHQVFAAFRGINRRAFGRGGPGGGRCPLHGLVGPEGQTV